MLVGSSAWIGSVAVSGKSHAMDDDNGLGKRFVANALGLA